MKRGRNGKEIKRSRHRKAGAGRLRSNRQRHRPPPSFAFPDRESPASFHRNPALTESDSCHQTGRKGTWRSPSAAPHPAVKHTHTQSKRETFSQCRRARRRRERLFSGDLCICMCILMLRLSKHAPPAAQVVTVMLIYVFVASFSSSSLLFLRRPPPAALVE